MYRFKKDNYLTYFENEDDAADWIIDNYDLNCQPNIIEENFDGFEEWVNDTFTASDILYNQDIYTYDMLHQSWKNYIISKVRAGDYPEIQEVEDDEWNI